MNQDQQIVIFEKNVSLKKKYIFKKDTDLLSFIDELLVFIDEKIYSIEFRITSSIGTSYVFSKTDFTAILEDIGHIIKLGIMICSESKDKTIDLLLYEKESISRRSYIKLSSLDKNWVKKCEVLIDSALVKIVRRISFLCSNTAGILLSFLLTAFSMYTISGGQILSDIAVFNLFWVLYAILMICLVVNTTEFSISKFKFRLKRSKMPNLTTWLDQDFGHKMTFISSVIALISILIMIFK